MALAFVSIISPIIRVIPETALYYGEEAAWVSPFVAAVPILLLYGVIRLLTKKRNEGQGLTHIILRAFGPWFGRLIAVVFALWLTFYLGFVQRMAAERLVSYLYNDDKWVIFALVMLITGCIVASGNISSLTRTAQIFVPVIIGMIVAVSLLLIPDVKIENLLPITYSHIPDALRASVSMISMVSIFAYFTFLLGHTRKQEKEKSGIGYIIVLLLIVFLVIAETIGVMSVNVAKNMQSAFLITIRNITFLNILERIEAIVIAMWVISDFVYAAAMLTIISDIAKVAVNGQKRTWWVWTAATFALVISVVLGRSYFGVEQDIGVYIPMINLLFTLVVIPGVLLVAKIRKVL